MTEKNTKKTAKKEVPEKKEETTEKTEAVKEVVKTERAEGKEETTKTEVVKEIVKDEGVSDTKKVKEKSKPIIKKESAHISMGSLPISTKQAMAISKYIKGKTIDQAMKELEEIGKHKRVLPMKGEIPHRKGNVMAGRYPVNSTKVVINVLRSLAGNANVNGIVEPVITLATATMSARPPRRGGSRKFKRTHLFIEVKEKIVGGKEEKTKK